MKLLRNKSFTQKIIIAIIFVILFNFSVPVEAKAVGIPWGDLGSKLLKELMNLIVTLGDIVMGLLNKVMLGTTDMTSAILSYDDENIRTEGTFVNVGSVKDPNPKEVTVKQEFEDTWWGGTSSKLKKYKVPNFMYSPEAIFGNKVAQLDVNFINPNTYAGIIQDTRVDDFSDTSNDENDEKVREISTKSVAETLSGTVADWYKSLRNIAIAGLLSVLVYIGIRILIGSTAQDKAKYKERLKDWVIALILVFAIHFIMAGILLICEQVTRMLSSNSGDIIMHVTNTKKEEEEEDSEDTTEGTEETEPTEPTGGTGNGGNGELIFRTNLMGYVRFMTQTESAMDASGYSIMYTALVIYTIMFTFTYLKRVLYMAFFTMIAPLVALTYPLDKMGDGKAQAFSLWLKEYTMNAIIQPVHLLLYTVLVTSAMDLAVEDPLYGIVALAFLTPAEKFIKKLFGLDKASSPATLGSMAAGGLALRGVGRVAGAFKGGGHNSNYNALNGSSSGDESQLESRGKSVRYNTDPYDALAAAGGVAAYGASREADQQQRRDQEQVEGENFSELSPEEMEERNRAYDRYQNEGYGQNANGEYFNPDIDDSNFNPLGNNVGGQQQRQVTGQQQGQRIGQQQINITGQQQQGIGHQQQERPIRIANQGNGFHPEEETIDSRVNRRLRGEQERARQDGTLENRNLNNYLMNNGGSSERTRNEYWDKRAGQIRNEERRAEARRIRERRREQGPQTKLGKGFEAAKDLTGMKIKNKIRTLPEASMKVAKNTVKGAAKTAAKVGGTVAGGAIGGALVAGAAVTSGENAAQTLISGISSGAGAGASVAGRVSNSAMDKMSSEYGEYKAVVQAAVNDPKEVKQKKQEEFDKNFKRNTDNYKYLLSKGMKPKQAKDFLQNRSQQFLDAGIDDIKLMHNAVRYQDKMKEQGVNIDDKTLVATTQIAKNLPSNFQDNKGLKKSYADEMMRKNSRITKNMAYGALDGAESIRFPSN